MHLLCFCGWTAGLKASVIEVSVQCPAGSCLLFCQEVPIQSADMFWQCQKLYCHLLSTIFHAVQVWKLVSLTHSMMYSVCCIGHNAVS